MRTMRRLRNSAFLALLVTLVWAGPVNLRADSGGYYCGYGDCTLTYDNCQGTWEVYNYPQYGLTEPGSCFIIYNIANLPYPGDTCDVNLDDEGSFHWSIEGDPDCPGEGQTCFACNQT